MLEKRINVITMRGNKFFIFIPSKRFSKIYCVFIAYVMLLYKTRIIYRSYRRPFCTIPEGRRSLAKLGAGVEIYSVMVECPLLKLWASHLSLRRTILYLRL